MMRATAKDDEKKMPTDYTNYTDFFVFFIICVNLCNLWVYINSKPSHSGVGKKNAEPKS
jgi:hypothetical protein